MASQNDPLVNPIWALRTLPAIATILLAVSMLVKKPNMHSMCVGGALGLLIGFCAFLTGVKEIVLKEKPQPSDVKAYPLT